MQGPTGYVRGGGTAPPAQRDVSVHVDETLELFKVVSIAAGVRGLQILISPADYLRATRGRLAPLAEPKKSQDVGVRWSKRWSDGRLARPAIWWLGEDARPSIERAVAAPVS